MKGENALNKYAEKGRNGVIEINTKNKDFTTVQDAPALQWGDLIKPRVDIDKFKSQKEIRVSDGWEFVGADIYFSGQGFQYVRMGHLSVASLEPIRSFIDQCTAGSVITLDNVYVKDYTGAKRAIEGRSFALYSEVK